MLLPMGRDCGRRHLAPARRGGARWELRAHASSSADTARPSAPVSGSALAALAGRLGRADFVPCSQCWGALCAEQAPTAAMFCGVRRGRAPRRPRGNHCWEWPRGGLSGAGIEPWSLVRRADRTWAASCCEEAGTRREAAQMSPWRRHSSSIFARLHACTLALHADSAPVC